MWVLNPETKTMVHRYVQRLESRLDAFHLYRFRPITFVPGFLKIFDEILVNASDNKVSAMCAIRLMTINPLLQINDPTMDSIKVVIDREKNTISVYNNGRGIPVEMHTKEGVMIPELIFGHL